MAITDLECRNAKAGTNQYKLTDSQGLYLEVRPSGAKVWRQRYYYGGKEKLLTLGAYPMLTLVKAREARDKAKAEVAAGADPGALKRERKRLAKYNAAQTFKEVAKEWLEAYKDRWSVRHYDTMIARLEKHVYPFLGAFPIADIDAPLVYACVQKIEQRNTGEMSRRILLIINQVFRYAIITGRAKENVTVHLRGALKPYNGNHFASITIEELPELLRKLRNNEARLYRQTAIAMWLMIYTFVRTNELLQATWDEFDLEKAEWHIPAERMKMKLPHFVPLSTQAVGVLQELKAITAKDRTSNERQYVFPSITRRGRPMSNTVLLMALRRMKYYRKMTGHGFRALAMSTIKEKLGYRHEVVDRQLAHMPKKKVDQAYDRAQFMNERTTMIQQWADLIESL